MAKFNKTTILELSPKHAFFGKTPGWRSTNFISTLRKEKKKQPLHLLNILFPTLKRDSMRSQPSHRHKIDKWPRKANKTQKLLPIPWTHSGNIYLVTHSSCEEKNKPQNRLYLLYSPTKPTGSRVVSLSLETSEGSMNHPFAVSLGSWQPSITNVIHIENDSQCQ